MVLLGLEEGWVPVRTRGRPAAGALHDDFAVVTFFVFKVVNTVTGLVTGSIPQCNLPQDQNCTDSEEVD